MPTANVAPSTIEIILQGLEKTLNKSIDDYVSAVQSKAQDMISRGIDPAEVRKLVMADIANNTGDFKQLTGTLGSQVDKALGQTALDTSNEAVKGLTKQFEWVWEPGASHCETCEERNGKVKSFDDWESIGLPGAGTTDCGIYCKCTLMPVI